MIEIAGQIVLCLIIAALFGAIIGYLIGRIQKCGTKDKPLKNEDELLDYEEIMQKEITPHKEVYAKIPDSKEISRELSGKRPVAYPLPKNGEADDLKKIVGIGIKVENALYEIGVFHYEQIADWTKENIKWIDEYLSYEGRVIREEWVEQAKKLAKKRKN
jgi:predicted flap endonuclease-1-like 5' DNA nuclease